MVYSLDYSCRLFIHSEKPFDEVVKWVKKKLNAESNPGRTIAGKFFHIEVSKWNDCNFEKYQANQDPTSYRYSAWVEPIDEVIESHPKIDRALYLKELASFIIALRNSGFFTVAACEFEDYIAEKTGWNWSDVTPAHPILPEKSN